MRLKCIELAGFKSFVDPTRIELGNGITAIVGPNGCGKSNIVDAIRWVLGEHSARHLRGGVMDDLIFQGSDTRPPVAMCDVELTFAVEPGRLPAPYHEMDEIRIRRRLHREAGSDAFINGKMVRLKDVVDMFLDTGVSTRAYAIVEQDSIARMLMAKPEDRRLMLEEAAGIMKYRARKHETERKMRDTRINLDRVLDLLEEVRTQCRSLKQQASRAERFRKQQEELEQVQALSMGIRYRRQEQACQGIEQELRQSSSREDEIAREQAGMERRLAEMRDACVAHEVEAQAEQDRLRAAEQNRAGLQQQAERLAGERRLLAERKTSLIERLAEAEAHAQLLAGQAEEAKAPLAESDDSELIAAVEEAQSNVDAMQQKYSAESEHRDELLAEFERLRSARENAEARRRQAEAANERLQAHIARIQARQEKCMQQIRDAGQQLDASDKAAVAADKQLQQAQDELQQAQLQLDTAQRRREAAQEELTGQERLARRLQGDIQEIRGRLESQDVPAEVRDRLRSKGACWVDESLHVPEGLELAVGAALRGLAADARIPANPDLGSWRETIQQSADAPVAFFTGAQTAPASGSLSEQLGLAAEHPLNAMFANVLLVDDILGAADQLAAQSEFSSAVSRDGWRLEQNGWLSPPAHRHTATRLQLQRTLRDREGQLGEAKARLASLQHLFQQADEALNQQQIDWQQAHLAATEAQSGVRAARAHVEQLRGEHDVIRTRLEHLQEEGHAADDDLQHWREQLTSGEQLDEGRLDAARQALDAQAGLQQQAGEALEAARSELAAARQALALKQQARQARQAEKHRFKEEQLRIAQHIEEDKRRLERTVQDLHAAEQQGELDEALREAAFEVDRIHRQISHLRQQGARLQQQAHEAEKAERDARSRQQQAAGERQQIALQLASEQARLQDLVAEIGQRFHLVPEQLQQQMDTLDEEVDEQAILAKAGQLEERLSRFGPVNLLAIEEYQQAAEREGFLAGQAHDLEASLETLLNTIRRIDHTTKSRFADAFERTNIYFRETFPRLFGGGRAELRLDSDDPLTAGVEIIAQPPGKHLQDVSLLSGGEKALTAVALVFSIFRLKPAPFCILDEVDAPLDDANVQRFGEMLEELAGDVQFLAITHNKVSMQMANCLIGVSMPEAGVSRIVGVDIEGYEAQAVAA